MQKIILLIWLTLISFIATSQDSAQTKQDSVEMKDEALKERDKMVKNLLPIEGKAIIYIIRPTMYGFVVKMKLYCDSTFLGSTMAEKYVYTVLDPGKYTLISKSENTYKFQLETEAGKIYYIKQQVQMGILFATTRLKLLSESEGKKYLAKTKLSKDNTYK